MLADSALSARQGPGRGGSKARALGREPRGQEPQIRLAVDVIYPTWLLLDCLKAFADEQPDTRIELYETVLGGTDELARGRPASAVEPARGWQRRRAVRARCTRTHNERARAGGTPDA